MRKGLIAMLMMSVWYLARADAVGYAGVFDCRAENEVVSAEHHHDWSEATHAARWEMISTSKDVFTASNSYASLVVRDKKSQAELFRVPTPALTHLWISGDSRFIVGISNIKEWNPVQVVVFDSKGVLVLAKSVDRRSFPGVTESVSNWVHWYKEPEPRISIEGKGDSYSLHVEGNNGVDRVFQFQDVRR